MIEKHSVLGDLISSATRVLLRVAFAFEPLAPTGITILMNQQLYRYKKGGIIDKYKTHTRRLGKYHYQIELNLDLTGKQAVHAFANLFPQQENRFRRWFHE